MSKRQNNMPHNEEVKDTTGIQSEQDEFFTRQELHDYFAGRYPAEQIDRALVIFAENGAELDPTGDRFSLSITEELEEILKAVGKALENQLQLGEGQIDQTLTVLEANAIASQFSSHSNPQLMAAMIRLVTEEAIAQGSALVQLKSRVLEKVLDQGDMVIAQSLLGRTQQTNSFAQKLVEDDERVSKMLKGYGVETVDVSAFLEEVRAGASSVKQAVRAIAPSNHKTFDVDAFLLEAGD